MAKLSQIQVSFAPAEDRLLLRDSTDEHTEFQFWLTRRYVRLLWPILEQMVAVTPADHPSAPTHARAAIAEFEQASALASADFDTQYDAEGATRPLGQTPVLVTRIQRKCSNTGAAVLCMHPAEGLGIEVALDRHILHSLRALLRNAVAKAQWDLALPTERTTVVHEVSETLN